MPSVNEQDHLWIAVGDIHDEPGLFARIPELAQADGIIVTGDLTITGGVKQAEMVMDVLRAHNPRIWAQIGNMDRPEVDEWLSGLGCNLHTQVHELTPDTSAGSDDEHSERRCSCHQYGRHTGIHDYAGRCSQL